MTPFLEILMDRLRILRGKQGAIECIADGSTGSTHISGKALKTLGHIVEKKEWEGHLIFTLSLFFKYVFIDFRKMIRKRQRETDRQKRGFVVHLLMHSLIDSCMCPDQGSNPQAWHSGMML